MSYVKRHFEMVYWWLTLVTFIGSLAFLALLLLISFAVGFESAPFDWLFGLTVMATVMLMVGAINSLSNRRTIAILILAASSYLPTAFVVLTAHRFTPPLPYWSFFVLNFTEAMMSIARLVQLSSPEVRQWQ